MQEFLKIWQKFFLNLNKSVVIKMKIENLTDYKYKIEAHCHSKPVSPCGDFTAEEVVRKYAEKGFDALVLTNHFFLNDIYYESREKFAEWFLADYYRAVKEGEKFGVKVYLGMEIRFSLQNNNDYLVYGIDENDVRKAADFLESDIETFYKSFKNDKNVILQAHPYRNNIVPAGYDVVDGYETFNMHQGHNSRVGFAVAAAKKKKGFLMCGGSDFHHETHQGMIATLTKTLPENSFEFAEILKNQDFIFDLQGSIIIP